MGALFAGIGSWGYIVMQKSQDIKGILLLASPTLLLPQTEPSPSLCIQPGAARMASVLSLVT